MSDAPTFPVPLEQAFIDSYLGATLVQTFLSGFYLVIFYQAIVPLIRDGKRKAYSAVLTLLFCMVMLNLATTWRLLRSIFVVHDATRATMALELLTGSVAVSDAANASGCIAIVIADSLLCWRCYVLWQRNKIMLAAFTLLLLGEVALIPILLVLNANLGPGQVSIICLFFFISIGVTVLATSLIIYRVVDVSSRSTGQTRNKYQYTIEILIESGVMYSSTLLIAGVLLAVRGNIGGTNFALTQAAVYWGSILTPVTGIAPTLIASRITSGSARDEKQWSQPVSGLSFSKGRRAANDINLSTIHGTAASNKTFSTGNIASRGDNIYIGTKISDETQVSFGNYSRSDLPREKNMSAVV